MLRRWARAGILIQHQVNEGGRTLGRFPSARLLLTCPFSPQPPQNNPFTFTLLSSSSQDPLSNGPPDSLGEALAAPASFSLSAEESRRHSTGVCRAASKARPFNSFCCLPPFSRRIIPPSSSRLREKVFFFFLLSGRRRGGVRKTEAGDFGDVVSVLLMAPVISRVQLRDQREEDSPPPPPHIIIIAVPFTLFTFCSRS